jgi:hypothetical protein
MKDAALKVISFQLKKQEYDKQKCKHHSVLISEEEWHIECADCGVVLDPIGYMVAIARSEGRYEYRRDSLMKALKEIEIKIKKRTRTKCQHCGKMTRIGGV